MPIRHARSTFVVVVALVLAGGAAATWAQGGSEAPAGSLSALTAELRLLRLSVEESTRNQTQTSALGVYLSAQQSRLIQTSSRLDAARAELMAATARSRELAAMAASALAELATTTDAMERAHLTEMGALFKQQADRAAEQEQQIRNREAELRHAFETEETRWLELISRLEQIVKR